MMNDYTALGVMSGSSLDGVDLALCRFTEDSDHWSYEIQKAETAPYSDEWNHLLSVMPSASPEELNKYDILYGKYLGMICVNFLKKNHLSADLIASHGHTIFHNPEEGYTFQLGNGQALASESGIKTICDFRTENVLLGGQGAPLVPIGDEMLFQDMDYCLNIGGIANISFRENNKRVAFDICPANQLLNFLSFQKGFSFDKDGEISSRGQLIPALFNEMNSNSFYEKKFPKSLGNEYVRDNFIRLFEKYQAPVEDLLFTSVKHIAFQIGKVFKGKAQQKVLVTGGGAHNTFLMNCIKQESNQEFLIPDKELVDFKEALIFAFMGVLRDLNRVNCLASYTGAIRDIAAGEVYFP
jgi:anhydro-N-acetylmuramic acid kinase